MATPEDALDSTANTDRRESGKRVFTTGQVAKICNVTIRTVIKWFDSGKLKGYKIPDSKDRRIPVENLHHFLVEHNIPFDEQLFDMRPKLLIADDSIDIVETLAQLFRGAGIDVHTATSGYEAGFETARLRPRVLLIDFDLGDATADQVLDTLKRDDKLSNTHIIVMTGLVGGPEIDRLIERGLTVVKKPLEFQAILAEVRNILGVS